MFAQQLGSLWKFTGFVRLQGHTTILPAFKLNIFTHYVLGFKIIHFLLWPIGSCGELLAAMIGFNLACLKKGEMR